MYLKITTTIVRRWGQLQASAERGASTTEWVIITAALLAAAVGVAVLVTNVINSRAEGIF